MISAEEINVKKKGFHIFKNQDIVLYPEAKKIFDLKHIIIDELNSRLINSNRWTNWSGYDDSGRTESFTKLSHQAILEKIAKKNCKLTEGEIKWKIFGFILDGKVLHDNIKEAPQIFQLLKNCGNFDNIINVGISCIKAGGDIKLHRDYNNKFYRFQIPLIIPDGDTVFVINNDTIRWDMSEYFMFDDTFYHKAWNKTTEMRFVLLLDLKRLF